MIFEGAKVQFIPSINKWTKEGQPETPGKTVTGKITQVNWQNRVFFVEYKLGDSKQTEAFKFFDIGKSVKILGR
jgi:hypothetical protein